MKRTLSLISKILFALLACSILDSALYLIFDSGGPTRMVRGEGTNIVGTLSEKEAAVLPLETNPDRDESFRAAYANETLRFIADSEDLRMRLADLRGRIWRGHLSVAPETMEGEYGFTMLPKALAPTDKTERHRVRVFESRRALRDSYVSFSYRYLGLAPWWVTGGTMCLVLLLLLAVYLEGGRETREMQARGLGPVYRLVKVKEQWELLFGLGREHGVVEGDRLAVLDADGHWLAEFAAYEVGSETARGRLDKTIPVKHDCLIARMWSENGRV